MDSIRAASPSPSTIYTPPGATTSAPVTDSGIAVQDGFILTSTDPESLRMNELRNLSAGLSTATIPVNQTETHSVGSSTPDASSPAGPAPTNTSDPTPPANTPSPAPSANAALNFGEVSEIAENSCVSVSMGTGYLSEFGNQIGLSAATGIIAGTTGLALSGVGHTALGATMVHEGVKNRNAEFAVGGAGNICDGISNGAAALNLATAGAQAGTLASTLGSIAGKIATPIGLASSAIDFSLGIKGLHDGIKDHDKTAIASGALGIAFGVATAAGALGGGLPAMIISGAVFIAKCGVAFKQIHDARRQRAQEPPQPPQPEPPQPTASSSAPNLPPAINPGQSPPPTPTPPVLPLNSESTDASLPLIIIGEPVPPSEGNGTPSSPL